MSIDVNGTQHSYPAIPGWKNYPLASKEEMLDENVFAEFSKEELKEIFNEYRYYLNNGMTPKGTKLNEKREYLCSIGPHSTYVMEFQLLNALAVRFIMEAED